MRAEGRIGTLPTRTTEGGEIKEKTCIKSEREKGEKCIKSEIENKGSTV